MSLSFVRRSASTSGTFLNGCADLVVGYLDQNWSDIFFVYRFWPSMCKIGGRFVKTHLPFPS
jgi:hypothetical protein